MIVEVGGGVPRVDGGAQRCGLILIGAVLDEIDEVALRSERSNIEFADRVTLGAPRIFGILPGGGAG